MVTFLPSRCVTAVGGCTYRHTDLCEGFRKYAVETSAGVVVCIPSFIKIVSDIQKLIMGTQRYTEGMEIA